MIKKMISTLCAMIFCLGLLPIAAYAVEGGGPTEGTVTKVTPLADGDTVYVGGVALTGSAESPVYATTDDSGNVITEGATADNYNIKWDGNTLSLNDAKITGASSENTNNNTVGIYASSSGVVSLNIELQGENTITSDGYGILVYSPDQGGAATLNITGENGGSLNAGGSGGSGIQVQSNNDGATLTIQNAEVTAASTYSDGVQVQSGAQKSASLSVDGSSLTATGKSEYCAGIRYTFGNTDSSSGTSSLNVSNSAIVKASGDTGGITSNSSPVTPSGTGIVFNNGTGTVYGSVTLQEDLTIGEGESLDIPNGASLTIPNGAILTNEGTVTNSGALTNNGTINNSGTLPSNISGTVPPSITTSSPLGSGTVDAEYSVNLAAIGNPTSWTITDGSLPTGLTLAESSGLISGTPTTQGTYNFTATATNSGGSDSEELSIKINPAAKVPVESVSLSHTELSLTEGDTGTLTATVKPDNATNKDVTWSSDNPSVATVNNGVVTAVSKGAATITVTTEDGNKTATCKVTVTHGPLTHVSEKAPTCTADGNEEYWTCETCSKYFSDANGNIEIAKDSWIISAMNHNWNDAVYIWNDDGSTCTATRTCKNDNSHTETSKATVTDTQTKAPTCTEKGETTYTATFEADWATTQTKVLADIPTTGHSYGKPVWSWSEDGKNCTATFTCVNDASHVETLAATITSKVKTPATCTEKGITEYSASVSFNGNTYTDIKEVADIPATGHHYIEGKCSVCGAVEATATVPDTDNSQEGMDNVDANNKALPETSDSTLPLAAVALILGIGAITGIVIALRNMRQ